MQTIIEVEEVKNNFDQILHRVCYGKEHVVFRQDGQNVAALIGISDFEEFLHWRARKIHED